MKVLIVAPNISMRMGGEAVLPYHLAGALAAAGIKVAALTHARVREELKASSLWRDVHFHFVEDAPAERMLYVIGKRMPGALREMFFETAIGLVTLSRLAKRARTLCLEEKVDLIHQPTPVSPRLPSFLLNMPAPVIIGPLNGNMAYPSAFRREYSRGLDALTGVARTLSDAANAAIPGKRRAQFILVANERTRKGLPKGVRAESVEILVENGVNIETWTPLEITRPERPTFAFVGRLVPLKGVDLLIEAFARLKPNARLLIIGDGDDRPRLEKIVGDRKLDRRVEFFGFRPPSEIRDILANVHALVLPSMRECGGAVILEAFACGTPAIATDWGGPQDYITPETGVLVAPTSRVEFIESLAAAMRRLSEPALSTEMGKAARRRVEERFSWGVKAQRFIEIYRRALKA